MSNYAYDEIVSNLRKRAEIRRNAKGRKSVEEGKPDRLADQLDEAANIIEELIEKNRFLIDENKDLQRWIEERD